MSKHTIARQTQETSIDDSNKIQTHIREIIGSDPIVRDETMKIMENIINRTKNTNYKISTSYYEEINTTNQEIQFIRLYLEKESMTSFLRCSSIVLYDFKNDFIYDELTENNLTRADREAFTQLLEIFELERVESCFAMISADVEDKFEKDRKCRGLEKGDNNGGLNPMTAVLFARDGRHDKLRNTEFEFVSDYLKQVHNMGSSDVSVKLVFDYFQKYVKDWLHDMMREIYMIRFEQNLENNIKIKRKEAKEEFIKSDLKSEIRYKERIKTLKSTISDPVKLDKKLKQCEVSYKKRQNSRIDKLTKARIEISKLARDKSGIEKSIIDFVVNETLPSGLGIISNMIKVEKTKTMENNNIIINETIEELKEQGKQLVNNINGKILESCKYEESQYSTIYKVEPMVEKYKNWIFEVNFETVDILEDIFKQITTQYNNTNNTNDINDINNENKQQTIDIIIGIDCSSIPADDLHMCRNICATLFRTIETLPNINMKFIPYRGKNETTLYADVYETYEDIKYISTHIGIDCIHMAHQHIDDLMSNSTADRKIAIMITDSYTQDTYHTIQAVKNSKKLGNEVYCIITKPDSYIDPNIRKTKMVYGENNFIACEDYNQIDDTLITLVQDLIGKQ